MNTKKKKKLVKSMHDKEGIKKKVPTYLTRRGRVGQFAIQPIPVYCHKFLAEFLLELGRQDINLTIMFRV